MEEIEQLRVTEGDLLEDDTLEQQSRGKDKAEMKKWLKRGPKAKVKDGNPAKSTRLFRKKKTDMSSFFWNVREFNKSLKHYVVKVWIGNKEMKFGCILETRVKEKKAGKIIKEGFREWSVMTNYDCSPGGRIWVFGGSLSE